MNKGFFSISGMNKLNNYLQTIGALGIIASLVFVGLELRQTQKIALNAQNQARSETVIEHFKFLHENDLPIYVWIKEGIKEIAIYSPSFVADCLETTDELGHELVNEAKELGGNIYPIECLNTNQEWCKDIL